MLLAAIVAIAGNISQTTDYVAFRSGWSGLQGKEYEKAAAVFTTLQKKEFQEIWDSFFIILEAAPRFELGVKVLQTAALPLGYTAENLERETGLEPATTTLAR